MPRKKKQYLRELAAKMREKSRLKPQALIDGSSSGNVAQGIEGERTSCQSQAESQQASNLEVALQIKNSLTKLRRKSNPEETGLLLELEVFLEKTEPEKKILKYVDESQPLEEPDEDVESPPKRKVVKRKKQTPPQPASPVKRNLRRQTVLAKQQKEIESISLNPAYNADGTSDKNDKKEDTRRANKPKREIKHLECIPVENEPLVIPSSLEYKEQLYEFGKFVAEQLMTFSEIDARAAQTEIKEVIKTYRLKYKIRNCLTKPPSIVPSTSEIKQNEPSKQIKQKLGSKTQPKQVKPTTQQKTNSRKTTKTPTLVNSSGKKTNAETQSNATKTVNVTAPHALPCEPSTPGSVSQAGPLNVILPSMISTQLSQSDFPSLRVIVPGDNGSLKLTSAQKVDSIVPIVNFPNAPQIGSITPNDLNPNLPSAGPSVSKPTMPVIVGSPSVPLVNIGMGQSGILRSLLLNTPTAVQQYQKQTLVSNTGTVASQPSHSQTSVKTTESEIPGLVDVVPGLSSDGVDPLKLEPVMHGEDMDPTSGIQRSVAIEDAESIVFKCEASSDEDSNDNDD